eukprot:1146993-Pelagomonas_calceolata.AAC.1
MAYLAWFIFSSSSYHCIKKSGVCMGSVVIRGPNMRTWIRPKMPYAAWLDNGFAYTISNLCNTHDDIQDELHVEQHALFKCACFKSVSFAKG